MAEECRRVLASDFALAIGPFPPVAAEPSVGEPLGTEPAQMHFALASSEKTTVRIGDAGSSSGHLGAACRQAGLNLLRLCAH